MRDDEIIEKAIAECGLEDLGGAHIWAARKIREWRLEQLRLTVERILRDELAQRLMERPRC